MDILVIDRDPLAAQLVTTRLQALGHTVTAEPSKNDAFEKIKTRPFDCILVDPYPLSEARPVIIGIWKNLPRAAVKPYILLLSKAATPEEAVLSGANDVLLKPISQSEVETKAANAQRLLDIARHLAREDDAHSSGGMVGKAAFNQLFLSSVDRAFRYGERSLVVFIEAVDDTEIPPEFLKALTGKITFMRRQSDVAGLLGAHDFGILLQRPQYETEPVDAINRFSEILARFRQEYPGPKPAPQLTLTLVELPQGALLAEKSI